MSNTNQLREIQEQIRMASGKSPKGWEAVIWANKLTKNSRRISYGFNFQPEGSIKVGQVLENAWGGELQPRAICKAVAIA